MNSDIKITDFIDFNPKRVIKKGDIAPFVDMASLSTNSRDISEIDEREFKGGGSKFINGDTLFARITPCLENGKTAKVSGLPEGVAASGSTEFIVMAAKEPEYDEDYVYYLARLPEFRAYAQARMEGTSGRQRVPWQSLVEFSFEFPEKEKRKAIGSVLKKIDDKIELNRQTNQTLEQIAQAIFKSWFVDFEPTRAKIAAKQNSQVPERAAMAAISGKSSEELGQLSPEQLQQLKSTAALFPDALIDSELGEIPEGWLYSEIGKEVTVVGGGTPSTKIADFWEEGHINWTSPKDMSNLTDKVLLETDRKITKAGLAKISSGLLPENTVLMSSRAPVGYLAISKIPVAINQGYIAMKCERLLTPEYIVQWANSVMDDIKQRASGTTFAEISKKNFKIIPVILPEEKAISEYSAVVGDLYEKIAELSRETKSLMEARDTLLPKLLSGEMDLVG